MRRIFSLAVLAGLVAACTMPPRPQAPPPEPVPYRLELDFASELPDPYYVTAGRFDSYARFPVNAMLQQRLGAQLERRQTAAAKDSVRVQVRVVSLQMTYDEIGRNSQKPVQLAYRPMQADVPLVALPDHDGNGTDIPEETVKTARLEMVVTIGSGSGEVVRELTARYREVVRFDDSWARWPQDYATFNRVVSGIVVATVDEVDALLTAVLLPAKRDQ